MIVAELLDTKKHLSGLQMMCINYTGCNKTLFLGFGHRRLIGNVNAKES